MTLSGTFTQDTFNETLLKDVGGVKFYRSHDVHTYTGTFTGTDVFDGVVQVFQDGSVAWHGTSTFTGTVDGCGGGPVVMRADGGADDVSLTHAHCHQETLAGPIRANIDLVGDGRRFTYSGSYSC
jgi:hypothetical protein